jgi:peptidoglycan/xylan/chitin deacetylase (PgdA/CDA1 family)
VPRPIYLTFDDGPTPGVTDEVLDLLAAGGHRATFFCVGAQVERYPELARRIVAEGHAVGNHTYTHRDAWKVSLTAYLDEVLRTDRVIEQTLGERPKLFRPPYGKLTPQAWWRIRSSHQIVWWHALAWDWDARLSPEACYERLQWGLAPGRIAVLHDSIKAKDRVLPLLRKLLHEWEDKDWHSQVISK